MKLRFLFKNRQAKKLRIYSRYMRCRFCGYSGNFPDSGECPGCGETN